MWAIHKSNSGPPPNLIQSTVLARFDVLLFFSTQQGLERDGWLGHCVHLLLISLGPHKTGLRPGTFLSGRQGALSAHARYLAMCRSLFSFCRIDGFFFVLLNVCVTWHLTTPLEVICITNGVVMGSFTNSTRGVHADHLPVFVREQSLLATGMDADLALLLLCMIKVLLYPVLY
jgi:hypothetical protein